MKQIISSLDVGSNSIKLIVSEIFKTKLFVLSCVEVKSKGIKKGLIVDNELAMESIKKAIQKTEEIIGIKLKRIIVSVPSYFLDFVETNSIISINNEDNVITGSDITSVQKKCVKDYVNNKELVGISPINYIINEDQIVDNPKGMKSATLGINAVLVFAPRKNVYPILTILDALEVNTIDLCIGGLCDYYEFKNQEFDKSTCALVNFGKEKTEISIIDNGVIINSCIIELGSKNIDNDISYVCGIGVNESCKVKENFALSDTKNADTSETIDCLTREEEHIKINQYEVSEVVSSRIDETLEIIKSQINLLTKKEINYIIITGGGGELKDINISLDKFFGKKVIKAEIHELGARNNKFSTCLGLTKYYANKLNFRDCEANLFDEEDQKNMFFDKKDDNNGIFSKVYGYFFDN